MTTASVSDFDFSMFENVEISADTIEKRESNGTKYPTIQAETYKPKNSKSKVRLGLVDNSFYKLSKDGKELFQEEFELIAYDAAEVNWKPFPKNTRFVILSIPPLFVTQKKLGKGEKPVYRDLEGGMKLKEFGLITVAKVFVCALVNGEFVPDENGDPQIFGLVLRSTKTNLLIGNKDSKPGDGTIVSLNKGLLEYFKSKGKIEKSEKGFMGHLVSVNLEAVPYTFKGDDGSSLGIRYMLSQAMPLPPSQVEAVMSRKNDYEISEEMKNPFRIGLDDASTASSNEVSKNQSSENDGYLEKTGDIPF